MAYLVTIEYCRTLQHSETGAEMVAQPSTGLVLGEGFFQRFLGFGLLRQGDVLSPGIRLGTDHEAGNEHKIPEYRKRKKSSSLLPLVLYLLDPSSS